MIDTGRNLTWLLAVNAALLVLVSVIAGVSISMSINTQQMTNQRFDQLSDQYAISERESRVLQERLNDMKVELVKRGIPLSDH